MFETMICFIFLIILVILSLAAISWDSIRNRVVEGRIANCIHDRYCEDYEDNYYCFVEFEDGRSITFNDMCPSPIEKGKYYRFLYNKSQGIVSVTEVK